MDDARLRFLFGTVPPAESYADEDGLLALLAADRREPEPLRAIVAGSTRATASVCSSGSPTGRPGRSW